MINSDINDIKLGDTNINKIYIGNTTIWSAIVIPNPIAFYNFDDTNWLDSSGNDNTLTDINGGVYTITGINGYAAQFDGNNRLGTTSFGVPVNNDFTVTGWFKADFNFSGYQHIMGAPFGNGFFISGNDNGFIIGLINTGINDGAPYIFSTGNLSINTWYHLAYTRSGNNVTAYLNGEIAGSATIADGYTFYGNTVFSVGGGENNEYYFSGAIDAVGIWNTPLTQNQIKYLFNGNKQYPF